MEFDVILVEPPLEEYRQTLGVTNKKLWNWEKVSFLSLIIKYLIQFIIYFKLNLIYIYINTIKYL